MIEIKKAKPEMSMVSLFSGGGGLDLGLDAVGFSTLFATDIDFHSCITLKQGKEEAAKRERSFLQYAAIQQADILDLDANFILNATACRPGEITLLAGGPPCQAFSVFGKRQGRNDPRGRLVYEYLKILMGLRPTVFIFENVYGLLTIENGKVLQDMLDALSNPTQGLYYDVSVNRVNAVDYGVPQFRDRVFIIGYSEGRKITNIQRLVSNNKSELFDIPSYQLPRRRVVRDAFRGLPPIGQSTIPNHTGRIHSERIKERYASLTPGERDHYTRINKLNLDQPSFTIVVGSDKGGGKGHIHPIEPREVTPRESARIQTFPDWWAFSGTSRHPIRQIGNAVPPLLGAVIGNEIRSQLLEIEQIGFEDVLEVLDQTHLFEKKLVEEEECLSTTALGIQ